MKDRSSNSVVRLSASAAMLLMASACNMTGMGDQTGSSQADFSDTGLGYHQERYERAGAAQSFQICKREGLEMDTLARQSGSNGQYLTSADILSGCDAKLGSAASSADEGERMRVMALSAQNYANGGDAAKARLQLQGFKTAFRGRDLYFSDGTSWTQSFELALGLLPESSSGAFSITNANKVLKAEQRRAAYWLSN